ncbi:hypothetical protein MJH12_03855, partial [bacterium]|nr:hypothetical protein [bacterium]
MFYKLVIIYVCIFILTIQASHSKNIDVALTSGWNLVSFPMNEDQINISSFLDSHLFNENGNTISSNEMIQEIWGYHQKWECFIFSSSSTTCETSLESLKVHHGYWLLVSQNGRLGFSSDEYSLRPLEITTPGWHLLGMNIKESSSFKTKVLFNTSFYSNHGPSNVGKVMNYNSQWRDYYSETSDGELQTMEPGRGYWFFVEELDQTISQNSPLSIQTPKINPNFVPKNPVAISQDTKVALSWDPIDGANTYNVYYSTSSSLSTSNYFEKFSVSDSSNTTKTNLLNTTKY